MPRDQRGRGATIHITLSRLTARILREKVAAHMHAMPDSDTLVIIANGGVTLDAQLLALVNNWRARGDRRLKIIIRKDGI